MMPGKHAGKYLSSNVNVVVCGHVDAGKSTLVLFYLSSNVNVVVCGHVDAGKSTLVLL